MEKYFLEMNNVCLMILRTFCTSSDEKVKALTLVSLMLDRFNVNFEYTNEYLELYNTLNHCASLKKQGESGIFTKILSNENNKLYL